MILKEKYYKKYITIVKNEINNLLAFNRISYQTSLDLIKSKSIEEALSIIVNNNILITTFTSIIIFPLNL